MGDQRSAVAVVAREIQVPLFRFLAAKKREGREEGNVAKSMNKVFE